MRGACPVLIAGRAPGIRRFIDLAFDHLGHRRGKADACAVEMEPFDPPMTSSQV